jgi:hypothetical protein
MITKAGLVVDRYGGHGVFNVSAITVVSGECPVPVIESL